MKIKILARYEAEASYYQNPEEFFNYYYLISINESTGSPLIEIEHPNLLSLYFDDVERDFLLPLSDGYKAKCMTKDQAKQIVEFVDKIPKDAYLLIHCHAGISRSGAVGTWATEYLGQDLRDFEKNNSQIRPNCHVLNTLIEVSGMDLKSAILRRYEEEDYDN